MNVAAVKLRTTDEGVADIAAQMGNNPDVTCNHHGEHPHGGHEHGDHCGGNCHGHFN